MTQPPSSYRNWLVPAAKLLIVLLVVWAVRRTLVDAWQQLDQFRWHIEAGWLGLAGGLYLLGLLPAALFWHRVLRKLGQDAHLGETLRAYYIGHLGKYVPGKAMVVVLRTGLIRSRRVDTATAAVSVFFETLTMMATGAFLAAAVLAAWFRDQQLLFLLAVALMVAAGLPTCPPIFRRLVRMAGVGKSNPATAEGLKKLGTATLLIGWVAMTIGWILLGLSLWAVLRAMGIPNLEPIAELPRYTASVSLAMVAGFLSLIPGGAGVRELVLTELMVPYFSKLAPEITASVAAITAALLLRLVWLISELLASGILFFVRSPKRQQE